MRCKMSKIKERMICSIFTAIGKKVHQTSVSDADQEIPTLGSKDNAGNSVHCVSGIICAPSVWDFLLCIGDQVVKISKP